jgi:uncharacterized membrane protein
VSNRLQKRQNKASQYHSDTKNQALVQHTQTFQGPIPPPDILAKYEETLPGAADRILQMAEKESLHRRELEKHDADATLELNRRNEALSFASGLCGQIVAGLITMSAIAGGVICILNGKIWSGGFLGGFPIAAIVYIFVSFREPKNKEK